MQDILRIKQVTVAEAANGLMTGEFLDVHYKNKPVVKVDYTENGITLDGELCFGDEIVEVTYYAD